MKISTLSFLIFFVASFSSSIANTNDTSSNPDQTNSEIRLLKKDSLLLDIELLEQAMKEMHPGLYRYNTPEQIDRLFSDLKTNLPDEIPENEFMIRLAQSVREIKCGHTYLNPWNLNAEVRSRLFGGNTFFPLGFKVISGRFYITENASDQGVIRRGAELLSINGTPMEKLYEQLKTIAKTDGNNNAPIDDYLSLSNFKVRNWNAFDLYLQLFYPLNRSTFAISYRNFGEDEVRYLSVPAMSKNERAEKMQAKYGPEILEVDRWKLSYVNDDFAVIRLGTFAIWNWKKFDQKQWFKETFEEINEKQIKRLAIDLRGNGGGLSEPANELLSYIIKDSLLCDDLGKVYIRTTKFNPELLPYIDTWVKPLIAGLPEKMYTKKGRGLYELNAPSECLDIIPNKNRFQGETFIMGDASNVSATFTILQKANLFEFATYIGQESGGNQQGINGGEYAFFTMPYSKMEVDIPLKYFSPPTVSPDAGISPKIPIDVTQEDISKNIDPYLNYLSTE